MPVAAYASVATAEGDPWHLGSDPWARASSAAAVGCSSVTTRSQPLPPHSYLRGTVGAGDSSRDHPSFYSKSDIPGSAASTSRGGGEWPKRAMSTSTSVSSSIWGAFGPQPMSVGKPLSGSGSGPGRGLIALAGVDDLGPGRTWFGPAASGLPRSRAQARGLPGGGIHNVEASPGVSGAQTTGTNQLSWPDDFNSPGHEPLKGKYFNDLIIEKRSGGEILSIIEESMLEFSVVNAVTALHRIAKADDAEAWRKDPRIGYLNRRITKMFASAKKDEIERKETGGRVSGDDWVYYIDTRSLTNAAWAFAQLALRHDELMEAVSEETCRKIFDSNAQQLAILSWSMAKMLRVDLPLMTTLADETARRIMEFNSQHLMNFVWGCAKLKFLHIEVMMAIADLAVTLLDDFTPQHLSITAWAYATLGFRHRKLMDAIADEVVKTIRAFRPQNIANTAWAYATLELRNDRLMEALAQAALPHLEEFSQQNLTNLVWAFTNLRLYHEALFGAAAEQVITRVGEFNSQGLSMTASAFATLSVPHRQLFETIANAVVQMIDSTGPRDLENIVWSFASLRIDAPELFKAVAVQALKTLKHFTSLDLATMTWAFASVGHLHEQLLHAVASRAIPVIAEGSFPSQALAMIAWGFRTLGIDDESLFNAVASEVIRKLERQDLEHLVMLVDVGLPCRDMLARRLGVVIYHITRAFPTTPEGWRSDAYRTLISGIKVDHFGEAGTPFFLAKLGIDQAPPDFCIQASHALEDHFLRSSRPLKELIRAGVAVHRSGALAEYTINTSSGSRAQLSGTLVRESEAPTRSSAGKSRWLHAAGQLHVGSHVDRAFRGEHLVLEELCDLVLGNGRAGGGSASHVSGRVRLFSATYPCISCIGAMAQFRQLLPGIQLEAGSGGLSLGAGALRA